MIGTCLISWKSNISICSNIHSTVRFTVGWERDGTVVHPCKEGDLTFELLSGTDIIYTNAIMIERERAVECGGWDERFRRNQEAVFFIAFFFEWRNNRRSP